MQEESVKDTPISTQSKKAAVAPSNVAKSESLTTLPHGADNKELPRHPSIPEENMPRAQGTEGNESVQ